MELSFDAFLNKVSKIDTDRAFVLTANQRQARQLSELISSSNIAQSVKIAPTISPLSAWVQELWEDLSLSNEYHAQFPDEKRLISDVEANIIFTEVVDQYDKFPSLVNKNDFLRQIQSAYDISESYLLPEAELSASPLEETQTFLNIRDIYFKQLESSGCIDKYQFLKFVAALPSGYLDLDMYLYGFSEVTPLDQLSVKSLSAGTLYTVALPGKNVSTQFHKSISKQNEVGFAANWAKEKLKYTDDHPAKHIAIVVPDLAPNRHTIERALMKALEPQRYIQKSGSIIPIEFDISAGHELTSHAITRTAMLIPKLAYERVSIADAAYLLRSPYWGEGYSVLRQHLDDRISNVNEDKVSLFQFLPDDVRKTTLDNAVHQSDLFDSPHHEQESEKEDRPQHLAEVSTLQALRQFKPVLTGKKTYQQWVTELTNILQISGFPGAGTLSSFEYQLIKRLFTALNELSTLDAFRSSAVSYKVFEQTLEIKLKSEVFQPEVVKPTIRVLGLMEAAGLVFDHCLVIGLTERTLPSQAKPHPLLPITVQKQYNTPRSTAERELAYAEKFLQALALSATHLELSYHEEDESGTCDPSPLLLSHCLNSGAEIVHTNAIQNTVDKTIAESVGFKDFEHVPLGLAPCIQQGQKVTGGAYHLDLHWANPLFAFFKYRLRIDEPDEQNVGISHRDRGTLVHTFLYNLYKQYSTRDQIADFLATPDHEQKLLNYAKQLLLSAGAKMARLNAMSFDYEITHLVKVGLQVLAYDRDRESNFEVHALESAHEISILGRVFNTRIDRIDQLSDGLMVIDYKTGKSSLAGLTKEILTDHQLPFYSLALNNETIALAYMDIDTQNATIKGLSDSSEKILGLVRPEKATRSKLPADWCQVTAGWQDQIIARVHEITEGHVDYHPRSKSKQSYYEHYMIAVRPEEKELERE